MPRVDRGDDLGLARPQHRAATRRGRRPAPAPFPRRRRRSRRAASPSPAFRAPQASCLDPGSRPRRRRGIERPARAGGGIETVDEPEPQPLDPGPGDHRAHCRCRAPAAGPRRRARPTAASAARRCAQPGVGGDAAGDDQASALRLVPAEQRDGVGGAVGQRLADRRWIDAARSRPVARIERVAFEGDRGAPRSSAPKTRNRSRRRRSSGRGRAKRRASPPWAARSIAGPPG